jgi:excinuclease ABC subunit A
LVSEKEFEALDPREFIIIKGARVHNLKNVTVAIPRKTLTVITGLSGSGKSSLAFDTLYAEGQRRYVESLSAYARQFLGRLDKPEVDYIKGISPAVAIEQKVTTRSSRSTVGTSTEIYDYLKLLFARVGVTYSPVSGNEVKRHSTRNVVDFVLAMKTETRFMVCSTLHRHEDRSLVEDLKILQHQGF